MRDKCAKNTTPSRLICSSLEITLEIKSRLHAEAIKLYHKRCIELNYQHKKRGLNDQKSRDSLAGGLRNRMLLVFVKHQISFLGNKLFFHNPKDAAVVES